MALRSGNCKIACCLSGFERCSDPQRRIASRNKQHEFSRTAMNAFSITPLLLSGLMVLSGNAWADDVALSREQRQERLNELSRDTVDNEFETLRQIFVAGDKDKRQEGIQRAFGHRRTEAVDLARKKIRTPEKITVEGGRKVINAQQFNMAADILAAFPDDSLPMILHDYKTGDAETKANILRAVGNTENLDAEDLLIKALNDKTSVAQHGGEADNPPMRICDVAYNAFLQQHQIIESQGAIGVIHSLATRDERIRQLKKTQLNAQN
jgi:hypothetical protein